MSVGFILLVHTALDRAAQVARHWAGSGCPVVIHADRNVPEERFDAFRAALAGNPNIRFVEPRRRCEWGTWGIVGATIDASALMLKSFPQVDHVYLASGSCLPLRPVPELRAYLAERPRTDFIESATIDDVDWSKGGFDHERFTLRFPFAFKTQRGLFDRFVTLQRGLGMKRSLPAGLVPHLGSQWWCLTRPTLEAILGDPRRGEYERFFRSVWIPDESYFQSLVRLHANRVESRSLTLSKFDFQGKPHTFYDDHLQLLRRSDCFVARKIWPQADRLYSSLLSNDPQITKNAEPNPGKIDRLFTHAVERRLRGRPGLYMQSRFPLSDRDNGKSCGPYSVFEGFSDLFEQFESWLSKTTGCRVHGHLYAPDRAHFAGGEKVYNGCLPDSAALRDYNPCAFLTNLTWSTRGERQCFMFGPADNQYPTDFMTGDPHAQISVITGAWAIRLFRRKATSEEVRKEAARLQRIEQAHVERLRAHWAKARIRIWTLAEFIEAPMDHLQEILDEVSPRGARRLTEAPRLTDLTGFGRFLQELKNEGMNLHVAGDFPAGFDPAPLQPDTQRRYVVK
ncbi:beta-1,6-N-acetylglucosaminyltransferase [Tropicimonas sediminicola]|uniref:Peptide O-xylosyltransferase n=1 Tax=Tropicimonas sediminicola TaxID=1031541 RepID=A0A239L4T1_9RHOB|nr:beta-1,6-N-acetylglucosaminyltransferase [Tropicimonas sediminicola]SNT24699.1 Core-2/I-Branching enzyme [Tropicimonas sediminicola]